jgi:hypothetical protein
MTNKLKGKYWFSKRSLERSNNEQLLETLAAIVFQHKMPKEAYIQ